MKRRWLLPTNTNNLRMIIAQGIISSHDGFSKYYKDELERHNGWIPLYSNKVPCDPLKYVVSEAPKTLIACILELDIASINGSVKAIAGNELIDITLPNDNIDEEIKVLFIPAPLPLSCLSKVLFDSKDRLTEFQHEASNRRNVVLNKLKLQSTKIDQKLFNVVTSGACIEKGSLFSNTQIQPSLQLPQCDKINYPNIYAFGGMLAALFYYAKNGELSNNLYKNISNSKRPAVANNSDDIQLIYDYFFTDIVYPFDSELKKRMYQGLLHTAIEGRDFKNDILNFLENTVWEEDKAKSRADSLVKRLREYESTLLKESVSEQFDRAQSNMEKMLLILFVREDFDAFSEYTTVTFTEIEYVIFAMLFGIRDKFIKLPVWLRKYNGLQNFISTKMAEYAHQSIKSNITFQITKEPLTVWEFLDQKLEKKTIKTLNIDNCIETIMPKCDFYFTQKDNKTTYASFIEPTYRIIKDKYFKEISALQITDKIYNKM